METGNLDGFSARSPGKEKREGQRGQQREPAGPRAQPGLSGAVSCSGRRDRACLRAAEKDLVREDGWQRRGAVGGEGPEEAGAVGVGIQQKEGPLGCQHGDGR